LEAELEAEGGSRSLSTEEDADMMGLDAPVAGRLGLLLLALTLFTALGATILGWLGRTCMKKKESVTCIIFIAHSLIQNKQSAIQVESFSVRSVKYKNNGPSKVIYVSKGYL
jgi:hypothetical protein